MSSGERWESGSGGGQSERLNKFSLASEIQVIKNKLVRRGSPPDQLWKKDKSDVVSTRGDARSQTGLPLFNKTNIKTAYCVFCISSRITCQQIQTFINAEQWRKHSVVKKKQTFFFTSLSSSNLREDHSYSEAC